MRSSLQNQGKTTNQTILRLAECEYVCNRENLVKEQQTVNFNIFQAKIINYKRHLKTETHRRRNQIKIVTLRWSAFLSCLSFFFVFRNCLQQIFILKVKRG